MIKFHRPSFLIAQPGTPPAQRTLLQKIFHKKKDDLSPDERRAMQMDADRSNRKKLFGGWISIERKKPVSIKQKEPVSIEQKKPDLQALTTATVEHLRALASRMRELDAKQKENDQANEAKRIADMQASKSNDEVETRPLDAKANTESLLQFVLEGSEEEIQETGNSDEERSVAGTQQSQEVGNSDEERSVSDTQQSSEQKKTRFKRESPVEALAKTVRRYTMENVEDTPELYRSTSRRVDSIGRAIANEEEKNDMYGEGWRETLTKQNRERIQVANEIVNIFSAAARDGIDLSKVLSNDEIIYLTRAMGMAVAPKSLHVETGVKVEVDAQGKSTEMKVYTGSFDPLKKMASQIAGLRHASQVDRLLERMNSAAGTLDESILNLEAQPPISAKTLLENVEKVLSTLTRIDPAELSRLCNQPGEQGDLAEDRILDSLLSLQAGTTDLHDGMQKALASLQSGGLPATEKRQLEQAARLLEQIQARVVVLVLRNEIAQTLEEKDTLQASSSETDSGDLFEIPIDKPQASLSRIDSDDDLFEIPLTVPPFSAPPVMPSTPPRTSDREISSEDEMQTENDSVTPQDSPERQAPSASTSGPRHRRSFSDFPQSHRRPFSSLRLSTGAAASTQERKDAINEASPKEEKDAHGKAPSKGMTLADYLNITHSPPTPDEMESDNLPRGFGWPLGLEATNPTRPNPRASEAAQLIEDMTAQHPAYTKIESDAPGNWLEDTGISIAANSGHGNDCLILSLLQHATGQYADNGRSLEGEAEELRQELISAGYAAEFENNQMLYADSDGFRELVNRVNTRHPQANMDVRIAVIDSSGRPYFPDNASASNVEDTLPVAARPNPGGNPVAILHQGIHYVALYSEHVSVASDSRPLKASTQSPDNIAQTSDATLAPEQTATTQTQAQEENQLLQKEGQQWVDQALARLKGLSGDLKSRLFKKAYSPQYTYAKSLSSEQRSQLEEVLESQLKGDAGVVDKEEEKAAVEAWLSIQQARLRTHTQEERRRLRNRGREVVRDSLVTMAVPVFAPPMIFLGAADYREHYRAYHNSPHRPEYAAAFDNFMRILGDIYVSEDLKEIIRERLTYHWKKEKTIAPREASLLGEHGIDKLVESNYRSIPPDTIAGRDIARQTRPLGKQMNVCLKLAKRPLLNNPQRFDLEQYADAFSRLLDRLSETTDASHTRTQAGLYEKAADVIEAIQDDAKLRGKVFEAAKEGLGTCHDNVADAFGSVVNEVAIHQLVKDIDAEKIGKNNFLSSIKPQFRLKALEEYVDQLIEDTINKILPKSEKITSKVEEIESRLKEQSPPHVVEKLNKKLNELKEELRPFNIALKNLSEESIETKLLFKTRLKEVLALPNSVPDTMAFSGYSPFQNKDIVTAGHYVRKVEEEGIALRSFLKEFSAWETGLKKLYLDEFAKVEEDFAEEEDKLYGPKAVIPDVDEDPEGAADYAEKAVNLGQRKNQAIQQVIAELTDEQFRRDSEQRHRSKGSSEK